MSHFKVTPAVAYPSGSSDRGWLFFLLVVDLAIYGRVALVLTGVLTS